MTMTTTWNSSMTCSFAFACDAVQRVPRSRTDVIIYMCQQVIAIQLRSRRLNSITMHEHMYSEVSHGRLERCGIKHQYVASISHDDIQPPSRHVVYLYPTFPFSHHVVPDVLILFQLFSSFPITLIIPCPDALRGCCA